ncbi:MAG: type II toxin-antitoxin system Phd/YefM family antitoxin [Candidatus Limnocylindrales bacterium]
MRAVGLKVLKNKLSEYVRFAASGETVLITDRERVVAELVPPQEEHVSNPLGAILADLVQRGWLTPATGSMPDPVPSRPVMTLEELLAELEQDRADR